ncbi:autotransporter assembly complex protein TamA [Pseudomonas mangiferae]|uniref:Translocation and assembly module subunit TamA n=1 Tax=Pseudomonas mangiferae TaxID=2593654 RepID=A0A553GVK2_9PSED|nr:autotransporter assembly complex family protein [Pseudomonas mangiferae]TRX73513.1 outer membrane protein assembly factor [Pseudomonas mangiferae]
MSFPPGFRRLLLCGLLCASDRSVAQALLDVTLDPAGGKAGQASASGVHPLKHLPLRGPDAQAALKANIEAYIGSLGERDENALQRYRRSAEHQAELAAQALGYYHVRVESRVDAGPPPVLHLDVWPGEPVHLRQVTVRVEGEAAALKAFQVPDGKDLAPGAQLDHGVYENAKKLIQSQALRYGFFDGRFTRQQLRIDPQTDSADIELVYDSGPRYRFGPVAFKGDNPFEPALLARMVPFAEGASYDADLVAKLNQNLRESGYFDEVRIDALPATALDRAIPVQVQLAPVKPRTLGLGLGYSTDVGPRARLDWTRHWVNAKGHSLGEETQVSAVQQSIAAWYQIPLDPPLTDSLRFTAGYQHEELVDVESGRLTLAAQWQTKLSEELQRVVFLRWEQEDYDYGDGSPDGQSTFLMPGLGYTFLRSDSALDPSRGYRLQAEVSGAKRELGSDADMLRASALAKGLVTLGGSHRLLGRVQVGGIATDDFAVIPPSLRFFAGGDQSVRGYDYQTLAPRDRHGNRVGGRYLAAGSAEYQYRIAERWRLAGFVDRGNAVNGLDDRLKTGIGFGVRWVSPVGPLRLDLAHALDDPGGVRLHFSMGPEL